MARLQLANLSKRFGKPAAPITALDQVTLEAHAGELLVLLGPSGCGKTTLLRLVAGLDQPASGDILLDGESIFARPPQHRSVGMAFQYPTLLPQLTVEQNIALGPRLRHVPTANIRNRVLELSQLLGIIDLLPRLPETLSGGQQQRVSLARALSIQPALLLLDEPLANLDPLSRQELRAVIRSIQQQLRVTTLYVTHDQSEAVALADRIALLQSGKLQQLGSSEDIYLDPSNLFVARFFSPAHPNILPGHLIDRVFRVTGSSWQIPTTVASISAAPVTAVIRPEAFQPTPAGPHHAQITTVQHTGWSTTLSLQIDQLTLRADLPPSPQYKPGEPFHFNFAPSAILLFHPETTLRVR